MGTWRKQALPVTASTSLATTLREAATEQDDAAGGRARRILHVGDAHVATASVVLKCRGPRRRLYAYLRYHCDGRNPEVYLGEVHFDTRAKNLREAWALAHAKPGLAFL
jgi:hypothetical protein